MSTFDHHGIFIKQGKNVFLNFLRIKGETDAIISLLKNAHSIHFQHAEVKFTQIKCCSKRSDGAKHRNSTLLVDMLI